MIPDADTLAEIAIGLAILLYVFLRMGRERRRHNDNKPADTLDSKLF
ncbi:MAG: hypothetical protein IPH04_14815 [Saprospirales bacterium]|nr:hypothetical protein [Saprospirales bacterium]